MSTLWKDIRFKLLHSGKLSLLIGINVIVFLLINISDVFTWLASGRHIIEDFANQYFLLPAYLPNLAQHFWTPLSYMFMNQGILQTLFDMLWLYWMGQLFEEYLGNKRILGLYIFGGIGGAILFLAAFNLIPTFAKGDILLTSAVYGAPACIMAVIMATATLLPDYTIFLFLIGPVKLKWLALFYVLLDFLLIVLSPQAEIAHLGGALTGFLYIKSLQRGNDWNALFTGLFKKKPNLKVASKNAAKASNDAPRQDEIDRILDKISQSGYDSLNKQEKETLFRASKDNE